MWCPTAAKGGTSKKPERTLCKAVVYALCLAMLLLARTQLLSSQHTRSLCDESGCMVSSSLHGAQLLLQAAARQVVRQHTEVLALGGLPTLRLVYEGSRSSTKVELMLEEAEEELAVVGAGGREQRARAEERQHRGNDGDQREEEERREGKEQRRGAGGKSEAAAATEGSVEGKEDGDEGDRTSAPSLYQLALEECTDLRCLSKAAKLDRHPGQFLFPHFYIVGWQKCATTSLFWHLKEHPQVLTANIKEPEFFSNECDYNPQECTKKAQWRYLFETMRLGEALEGELQAGAVEASTHYGRNGRILAEPLHNLFPWLRVIISMREPISRGISMLAHNLDKHNQGCLTRSSVYTCLEKELKKEGYAKPLQAWLEVYPTDQIFLIQYENLTSSQDQVAVLHSIKTWLGIDPELPNSDLGIRNTREYHLQRKGELGVGVEAEGWPMKRWQYEALVGLVRPDAQQVAALASKFGLADGKMWMWNWEREWQATLNRCKSDGNCIVHPS